MNKIALYVDLVNIEIRLKLKLLLKVLAIILFQYINKTFVSLAVRSASVLLQVTQIVRNIWFTILS